MCGLLATISLLHQRLLPGGAADGAAPVSFYHNDLYLEAGSAKEARRGAPCRSGNASGASAGRVEDRHGAPGRGHRPGGASGRQEHRSGAAGGGQDRNSAGSLAEPAHDQPCSPYTPAGTRRASNPSTHPSPAAPSLTPLRQPALRPLPHAPPLDVSPRLTPAPRYLRSGSAHSGAANLNALESMYSSLERYKAPSPNPQQAASAEGTPRGPGPQRRAERPGTAPTGARGPGGSAEGLGGGLQWSGATPEGPRPPSPGALVQAQVVLSQQKRLQRLRARPSPDPFAEALHITYHTPSQPRASCGRG